tara:strand:+ start:8072 stop:8572 length:501 start_codon:yes stop_codon:yes gene_type:complete
MRFCSPVNKHRKNGFTLIELMIVMSIVALLMGMVGPLAIQSLEKAEAKQEMLTLKNWLRKVSARAYNTGYPYTVTLSGKEVILYRTDNVPFSSNYIVSTTVTAPQIEIHQFETLFFQPQTLHYNAKGFVEPSQLFGSYRNKPLELKLSHWINGEPLPDELNIDMLQ